MLILKVLYTQPANCWVKISCWNNHSEIIYCELTSHLWQFIPPFHILRGEFTIGSLSLVVLSPTIDSSLWYTNNKV